MNQLKMALGKDLQEVMESILEQMNRLVACDVCIIWLLNDAGFQLTASRGLPHTDQLNSFKMAVYHELTEIIAKGKAIIWDGFASDWARENSLTEQDDAINALESMRSFITTPLLYREKAIGVLVLGKKEENCYSDRDEQSAMALANQVAMTIENTRLFQESQRQLNQMRALHDISVDISSRLEIQQVFDAIVKQAAWLLNAQGSSLAVCESGSNLARVVALHNIPFEYEELVLRPGASAASHVLTTGMPLIINDLRHWKPGNSFAKDEKQFNFTNYDALAAVPLIWQGQITGALIVVDKGGRRTFNTDDIQFLNFLANLAGAALNNSQLYSQVVQLNQQLEYKVKERTGELANAQKELAQKAEQLQQLLGKTVFLQEEERARIARDLHDSSNQLLTGTMYEVQAAQQSIQSGRTEMALEKLQTAKELLRQIDAENRRLISDLRPPVLDTHGLVTAMERLAERYQVYCGAKCQVKVSGRPIRLPDRKETMIYRILQESLNNIAAHAHAQSVELGLDFQATCLCVTVADDGVGFDVNIASDTGRMGLIGMRERAQSINSRLEFWSEPGQGTRLLLEVPLTTQDEIMSTQEALLHEDLIDEAQNNKVPAIENQFYDPDSGRETDSPITLPLKNKVSIVEELAQAIEELREEKALALLQAVLAQGTDPFEVLQKGILAGLKGIGKKFETQYYFLGELLTGTKLAELCIDSLKPYLPVRTVAKRGVVVIGAVSGDIHSIGYGLVSKQLELAGYEVHELGINVPSLTFIEKAIEVNADIIALSAFLVTTIPYCDEVVMYLKDMGIRNRFKVIIGGSETNEKVAETMGVDGWASDAVEAVRLCDRLLS